MFHKSCNYYFYLYVYCMMIFLQVNSVLTMPVNSIENSRDYPKGHTEEIYEIAATTEDPSMMEVSMNTDATTILPDEDYSSSSPSPEVAEHSNNTAILVGCLFAMTMIVKGVPVIIAYTMRWCSKSSGEDKPETEKEIEAKNERDGEKEIEKRKDSKILEVPIDVKQPTPSMEEKDEKKPEKDEFEEIDLRDCFICKQIASVN